MEQDETFPDSDTEDGEIRSQPSLKIIAEYGTDVDSDLEEESTAGNFEFTFPEEEEDGYGSAFEYSLMETTTGDDNSNPEEVYDDLFDTSSDEGIEDMEYSFMAVNTYTAVNENPPEEESDEDGPDGLFSEDNIVVLSQDQAAMRGMLLIVGERQGKSNAALELWVTSVTEKFNRIGIECPSDVISGFLDINHDLNGTNQRMMFHSTMEILLPVALMSVQAPGLDNISMIWFLRYIATELVQSRVLRNLNFDKSKS
jgi:hypothetical protein